MLRFLLLVLSCLVFINSSFAQTNKLDSLLQNIMNNNTVLGMSIAVVKGDSLVFVKGYGLRDVGRNLPIDNNTTFRIASISKTVTTIALMTLYDEGLFNLDDDISKHIGFSLRNPYYPNDTITIRKLLSHTGTLNDGTGYDSFLSATSGSNIPTLQSVLKPGGAYYSTNMFQNRSPKSNYFQYANINFGVIGALIEKLSGKRFDIVVRDNVLVPLGIDGSFNIQDLNNINDLAALYRKSGNTWTPQVDNYKGVKPPPRNLTSYDIGSNGVIFSPAGGLRISAIGLSKIMQVLANKGAFGDIQILSENATNLMLNTIWTYNGSNGNNYYGIFNKYALGNHSTSELLPGETLIGHPGEAYGLISDMYFSKIKNYGIVFICNGGIYNNGTYSGWYSLEEQVYKSVINSISGFLTDIENEKEASEIDFNLQQNYPNPFNPSTKISYSIPKSGMTSLKIFDILGKQVTSLVNEKQDAGKYEIIFDGSNLSSGVYLYKLESGDFKEVKKMMLIK